MLYKETVETGTLDLIKELMRDKEFTAFNLVGGTALSLKIGHRKSIDIDLFTDRDFDSAHIAKHLSEKYSAENIKTLKNGVFSLVNKVKLDILAHRYPILNKVEIVDEIRMLSLEDIGAMKLNAILYNGTRLKDFVDMYSLLEHVPLHKLTEAFEKKYSDVNKQMAHTALLYHKDVKRNQEIIFIGKKTPWKEIADRLREAVANERMTFQGHRVKEKQQDKLKEEQKRSLRKGHRGPRL